VSSQTHLTMHASIRWQGTRGVGELVEKEKRKVTPRAPKASKRAGQAAKRDRGIVGDALRSVYAETVEESIPAEMLELLGKLA